MCEHILKHSRTSPEIQFTELNEKLRKLYLTCRLIEQCQPKQKQNHLIKLRNKQTNQTKMYSLLKIFQLSTLRQNLTPLNIPISEICSKPIFVSEIGAVLNLQDLEKNHWPLKID